MLNAPCPQADDKRPAPTDPHARRAAMPTASRWPPPHRPCAKRFVTVSFGRYLLGEHAAMVQVSMRHARIAAMQVYDKVFDCPVHSATCEGPRGFPISDWEKGHIFLHEMLHQLSAIGDGTMMRSGWHAGHFADAKNGQIGHEGSLYAVTIDRLRPNRKNDLVERKRKSRMGADRKMWKHFHWLNFTFSCLKKGNIVTMYIK